MYGGGGGLVTNDWCIIYRNEDEMLDKVFVVFISFISPILYKIIEEAKHNRLVISAPLSILGGARWLSGRVLDSGARGRGFESTAAVLCP